MFAVMINALLFVLALASIVLLVDCGLRWWSAFGALRRQLRMESPVACPQRLPSVRCASAGFARSTAVRKTRGVPVSRAAA